MTTLGKSRPDGALGPEDPIPPQGTKLWAVQRWCGRRSLHLMRLQEECNEFKHASHMFGVFVEKGEGDMAMSTGPDTRSWMDFNKQPNSYNDHYLFLREEDARRYYEEPIR